MEPIITRNPKVMHGAPWFAGTRVTVQTFFDHLEAGYSVTGFLEQFPTVRREQVVGLLRLLREDAAREAVPGMKLLLDENLPHQMWLDSERHGSAIGFAVARDFW